MVHRFAVAIGAGCAAAFLFAVSAQTSPLAMALAYLAPLPIMIATMGWGVDAGAVAAATSVAGLALLAEPLSGLLYAASVAAPAWVSGRIRRRARLHAIWRAVGVAAGHTLRSARSSRSLRRSACSAPPRC